jgi:hypothetical protein
MRERFLTLCASLNVRRRLLMTTQHCADVSNPAKKKSLCLAWARVQEFFRQGDREREAGVVFENSPLKEEITRSSARREIVSSVVCGASRRAAQRRARARGAAGTRAAGAAGAAAAAGGPARNGRRGRPHGELPGADSKGLGVQGGVRERGCCPTHSAGSGTARAVEMTSISMTYNLTAAFATIATFAPALFAAAFAHNSLGSSHRRLRSSGLAGSSSSALPGACAAAASGSGGASSEQQRACESSSLHLLQGRG